MMIAYGNHPKGVIKGDSQGSAVFEGLLLGTGYQTVLGLEPTMFQVLNFLIIAIISIRANHSKHPTAIIALVCFQFKSCRTDFNLKFLRQFLSRQVANRKTQRVYHSLLKIVCYWQLSD